LQSGDAEWLPLAILFGGTKANMAFVMLRLGGTALWFGDASCIKEHAEQ
jgi:hypothetical protein